MLNNTGIKTEKYMSDKQILFAVEHQVSVGILVDQTAGVLVGNKKIAKAGTPLTGSLDATGTAFTPANSNGQDVVGILLHDVDVTVADNNGTLLLFGFVNLNRVDATTKAKLNTEVKKGLPMIKFATL